MDAGSLLPGFAAVWLPPVKSCPQMQHSETSTAKAKNSEMSKRVNASQADELHCTASGVHGSCISWGVGKQRASCTHKKHIHASRTMVAVSTPKHAITHPVQLSTHLVAPAAPGAAGCACRRAAGVELGVAVVACPAGSHYRSSPNQLLLLPAPKQGMHHRHQAKVTAAAAAGSGPSCSCCFPASFLDWCLLLQVVCHLVDPGFCCCQAVC